MIKEKHLIFQFEQNRPISGNQFDDYRVSFSRSLEIFSSYTWKENWKENRIKKKKNTSSTNQLEVESDGR